MQREMSAVVSTRRLEVRCRYSARADAALQSADEARLLLWRLCEFSDPVVRGAIVYLNCANKKELPELLGEPSGSFRFGSRLFLSETQTK